MQSAPCAEEPAAAIGSPPRAKGYEAYANSYETTDGKTITVTSGADGLTIIYPAAGRFRLLHDSGDTFRIEDAELPVHFERGNDGRAQRIEVCREPPVCGIAHVESGQD